MKRKSLLGATLALTSLATAGILVATNLPDGNASDTVSQSFTPATSAQLVMSRQEQRDNTAEQHRISSAKVRSDAAAKAAALRAAAAKRASATASLSARASRGTVRGLIYSGDARGIARAMLASFGWSAGEFPCLDSLWARESGWRVNAANPSGAYGIPQALPGSKMAAYGSDWQTNPRTQITWGLHYIQGRYGSPCGAWSHFQSHGWY